MACNDPFAAIVAMLNTIANGTLSTGCIAALATARLNESLAEMVSDTHSAWAPVFVPDRFVTRPAYEEDARQAAFRQLDIQYERLERHLQGKTWRVFDRRTVADAYLYVMCTWKDQTPTPLAAFPALAAFTARLDQDPDVQRVIEDEESGLPAVARRA